MKVRTWLVIATSFAIGLGMGAVAPVTRPAAAAAPPGPADTAQLKLVSKVLSLVRADYVFKEPTHKIIDNALNGMLSNLDPHSSYMDRQQYANMLAETDGKFAGLGMTVTERSGKLAVVSPLPGTPAAKAGIEPGDIIAAINGAPTTGISLETLVDKLRGPVGTPVQLTLDQPGAAHSINLTITRAIIHVDPVKARLFGNIGYMRLATVSENASRDLRHAVRKLERQGHGNIGAFILDLRDDPGGLLYQGIAVADDFLNSGEIVSMHGRHRSDDGIWYAHPGDILHGKPLVVLINSGTASAAEIIAAALQENGRAVVLGVRSFGKGSVQTIFPLDNEGAVRMTTALYYTPSGKSLQDYGVNPDLLVHETRLSKNHAALPRESSLPHAIPNPSGMKAPITPPPLTLPEVANTIAPRPPANWPKFVPGKPATDYQLQMALTLAHAMEAGNTSLSHA